MIILIGAVSFPTKPEGIMIYSFLYYLSFAFLTCAGFKLYEWFKQSNNSYTLDFLFNAICYHNKWIRCHILLMLFWWFKDVSPCLSGPCKNNGTCDRNGLTQNYTCICVPGFTGRICEKGISFHRLRIWN